MTRSRGDKEAHSHLNLEQAECKGTNAVGTVGKSLAMRELAREHPAWDRRALRQQIGVLHRRVRGMLSETMTVCRRLMTVPSIGPIVALTHRVTVDVSARFRNQIRHRLGKVSRSLPAVALIGPTPAIPLSALLRHQAFNTMKARLLTGLSKCTK